MVFGSLLSTLSTLYALSLALSCLAGWERQSSADLHGASASQAFPELHRLQRWRADLTPGSLLYIPSNWLHEVCVHAQPRHASHTAVPT